MHFSNLAIKTYLKFVIVYFTQLVQQIDKSSLKTVTTIIVNLKHYKQIWNLDELLNNLEGWVACLWIKSNGHQIFRNDHHVPLLRQGLRELKFYRQVVAF